MDCEVEELTDSEVLELVRSKGLPHQHCRAHQRVIPKDACLEEPESMDSLVEEGAAIGSAGHGRGGLPSRLQTRAQKGGP